MNKRATYTTIAGTGLFFAAACSGSSSGSAERAPAPVVTVSPQETPPIPLTLSSTQAHYLAQVALGMERKFKRQVHGSGATLEQAIGVCPVIAYQLPVEPKESVVVVADPVTLTARDKKTGDSISIAAAYDEFTGSFIFGAVRLGKPVNGKVATGELPGPTQEVDIFPPIRPQATSVTVVWSAKQDGPVDTQGQSVMDVAGEGYLSGKLKDYANSNVAKAQCVAGLQNQITSSAPITA